MKREELDKIRNKSIAELNKAIAEERKKMADLRLQLRLGKLKNVRKLKLKRSDIAQLLTVKREKELKS